MTANIKNVIITKSSLNTKLNPEMEAIRFAKRALKEGSLILMQSAYNKIFGLLNSKRYSVENEDNLYGMLNCLFTEVKDYGVEAVQGMLA